MLTLIFFTGTIGDSFAARPERPIGEKVSIVTDSDWINNEEIIYARHIRYIKFDYSWLANVSKGFETIYKTENYLIKRHIYTGEEEILLEGPHMGALSFSPVRNVCAIVVYEERSPGDDRGPRSVYLFDMATRELRMIVEGAERPLISPNGEIVYCEIQGKPVLYWMDTGEIEKIYEQGFVSFDQWDRDTNELICKGDKEKHRFRYNPYTRKTIPLDLNSYTIFNFKKDRKSYFGNRLVYVSEDNEYEPMVRISSKTGVLSPDKKILLSGLSLYDHAQEKYLFEDRGYSRESIFGKVLP
ncbi:MAG: hypothetical protein JW938_00660 [Candidatus Omnitrophica bacterium]|nr:hypothetical protein [Candidatus Omnitrophota bacterium]